MNKYLPWYLKIGAKLVLSKLPVSHRTWNRLGVFRHGYMQTIDYPKRVLNSHLAAAPDLKTTGATMLEIGPGDSVASGLLCAQLGALQTYLVDVDDFAIRDPSFYAKLSADDNPRDFEKMLRESRIQYLTDGLQSLRSIPASSVDFVWSQAVLEHVRKSDFPALIREVSRVLRPGRLTSHVIDLRDHLGGALNSLRFSESLWEKEWMAKSGFYTNRLRPAQIQAVFRDVGLVVESCDFSRWDKIPTSRDAMTSPFKDMSDEELTAWEMRIVARKPQ